jgi:hypothetical protein
MSLSRPLLRSLLRLRFLLLLRSLLQLRPLLPLLALPLVRSPLRLRSLLLLQSLLWPGSLRGPSSPALLLLQSVTASPPGILHLPALGAPLLPLL